LPPVTMHCGPEKGCSCSHILSDVHSSVHVASSDNGLSLKRPFYFFVSHISYMLFLLVHTKLYLCPPPPPKIWSATFFVTYFYNQPHLIHTHLMTLKKGLAHLSGTQASTFLHMK
jgi:hypothetical protein